MPTSMPMIFSIKKSVPVKNMSVPQSTSPQVIQSFPKSSNSRFSMHDLYKVAKTGCKSCGG